MKTEQLIGLLTVLKNKADNGKTAATHFEAQWQLFPLLPEILSHLTTLEKRAEAGEKLAEAVKQYADSGCTCLGFQAPCAHKRTATALAEYESSL